MSDHEPLPIDRLRAIAELADHLTVERVRIDAPTPDDNAPWGELCAWANRGSDYMATIRANPPEEIYRELLGEVERLRAEIDRVRNRDAEATTGPR